MLTPASLKLGSLVILAIQTSAFVLVARQSRKEDKDGNVYYAGTAVFLMELTKLCVSAFFILFNATRCAVQSVRRDKYAAISMHEDVESRDVKAPLLEAGEEDGQETGESVFAVAVQNAKSVLQNPSAVWLMVPAIAYVAQNNLQLTAATYLEPALFQTFTQGKLITTAVFSVVIMKRSLNYRQWSAILLLAVALAIVQQTARAGDGKTVAGNKNNTTLGFVLMMGAALLSGFAGVFTERMLKKDNDFWATNFYMASFSLVPATIVLLSQSIQAGPGQFHIMRAFGGWAWTTVMLNALGGLIVSMVLKFADSIAKGFSLAFAVILTIFINTIFFHTTFSMTCLFGIVAVLSSTIIYIKSSAPPQTQPQTVVESSQQEQESSLPTTGKAT